jgi:thioredoxin-related protein
VTALNNRGLTSILITLCLALPGLVACADESKESARLITLAESFVTDARLSTDRKLPIVVFVSQPGCQFCAALRKQVLFPMIRAGELADRAIFRELSLDAGFTVTDFDGNDISGRNIADRYAAVVTPTLLFLDARGGEVADKIVGIGNIEFYSFYFNRALESARSGLH